MQFDGFVWQAPVRWQIMLAHHPAVKQKSGHLLRDYKAVKASSSEETGAHAGVGHQVTCHIDSVTWFGYGTCTLSVNPVGNRGMTACSMSIAVSSSRSLGPPSVLNLPPGILPTEDSGSL